MQVISFFFKSLCHCIAMFTVLPCPMLQWEDKLRPMMTAMLPFVGLLLGGFWIGIGYLCEVVPLSPLVRGAVLCLFPWYFTGFLHLDGFMDCCDGILSRRDLETRKKIMKDPNCGAFSVISLFALGLIQFSAFASLPTTTQLLPLLWVATIPRCLSALAVLKLPSMSGSQYQEMSGKSGAIAFGWLLFVFVLALCLLSGSASVICGLFALVGWVLACGQGYRNFNGMSGDISGYAICIGEVCGVVGLYLCLGV